MKYVMINILLLLLWGCAFRQSPDPNRKQTVTINQSDLTRKAPVIKVTPKYVLFNSGRNPVPSGEKLAVYRLNNGFSQLIGWVRTVKSYDGNTVGLKLQDENDSAVDVGDFLLIRYNSLADLHVGQLIEILQQADSLDSHME
ncbi:hypothetical protein BVY01_04900 [bacterium I07]|nr:hypothetical protein BVY01_04900 [bacterium I07]